jgi:hypothetical protein
MENLSAISFLDRIRLNDGDKRLKDYYGSLVKTNIGKAINLVNDENLCFTSLFILQSDIKNNNLCANLDKNKKIAMEIINEVLDDEPSDNMEFVSTHYAQNIHSSLKWILETGYMDDGLNDDFDEIMDRAAAVLIKVYRDKTILPAIAELIFRRNKKGFFIHDLVWAFFEARDIHSLFILAGFLNSGDLKDNELCCRLLNFIPEMEMRSGNGEDRYSSFNRWVEENSYFLHYKGESFQQSGRPMAYEIVLEAKYLCKIVSVDTGSPLNPYNEHEYTLIDEFNKLERDTKLLLADFSFKLHNRNTARWRKWLRLPMKEQLRIAETGGTR